MPNKNVMLIAMLTFAGSNAAANAETLQASADAQLQSQTEVSRQGEDGFTGQRVAAGSHSEAEARMRADASGPTQLSSGASGQTQLSSGASMREQSSVPADGRPDNDAIGNDQAFAAAGEHAVIGIANDVGAALEASFDTTGESLQAAAIDESIEGELDTELDDALDAELSDEVDAEMTAEIEREVQQSVAADVESTITGTIVGR